MAAQRPLAMGSSMARRRSTWRSIPLIRTTPWDISQARRATVRMSWISPLATVGPLTGQE